MNYKFLAAARLELEEAFDYYEGQQEGLGLEFAREVYHSVQRILDHPQAWTKLSRRTRRCRTRRFPYDIIYQVKRDHVLIVAVMHLSRKPGYWKTRL